MDSAVSSHQLSDGYGKVEVLHSIDLAIPEGLTALLGPNGAGKTTLLNLICGLRRPRTGSMKILNTEVAGRASRQEIASSVGFLSQAFGFLPSYTVQEFVGYAAWLKNVDNSDIKARVSDALKAVNMTERAGSPMRKLSGGMIRRVGIASAIVHRPKLVVLDEPSAGLDPEQRHDLRRLLATISQTASVIVSTHQIDDLDESCSTIIILDNGRIRYAGGMAELVQSVDPTDPRRLERAYLDRLVPSGGNQ